MSPEELKALIASDPEASALFSLPDDEKCAARCRAIAPKIHRPLTALEVQRESSLSGFWGRIKLTAEQNSGAPAELRGVALTFVDWITSGFPLDLTLPELQPMVHGLIGSGLLPQAEFERMLTLTDTEQPITGAMVESLRMGWSK